MTLFCRNATTNEEVTSPVFFRNGVEIRTEDWLDYQGNTLHYGVHPHLEGEFTCGIMDDFGGLIVSNSLTLVGKSEGSDTP